LRAGLIGTGRIGMLHAETLRANPDIDELLVADADPARADAVAARVGATLASVEELLGGRADALVIAAATPAHAGLVRRGADAGLPMFCEKPLASGVRETRELLEHVRAAGVSLQVGFMRRFDAGYLAAREAVRSGRLGVLRTIRATTADPAPPHASYIPESGGIFRDCHVHDFDIIRFVTGREIETVWATGANRGASFFAEAGDVDTSAALLTLDDGTLATVTGTRYNGAGYDVRLEAAGSGGMVAVGLDDRAPLRSAEPGVAWPAGHPYENFYDRFRAAYAAELEAFVDHVLGRIPNPCPPEDALEAFQVAEAAQLSCDEQRLVRVAEVRSRPQEVG
jgi:myo-inositol 2-dehydrogenase/D-chiro-inositol 1-dehydrogenase